MTYDELVTLLRNHLPAGYSLDENASTGGGCYAIIIEETSTNRQLSITDGDSQLPLQGVPGWGSLCFSYYDGDFEYDGTLTIDAENVDADNVIGSVQSWLDGDPYYDPTRGELMKVRVVLSVEVDPETWELVYGTDAIAKGGAKLLREDVRCYVEAQVYGSAAREAGAITNTELVNR